MELTLFLYILLACISLGTFISLIKTSRKKLPPGPFPLPVIGNLLKLGNKPHISLAELSKIYGPIMSLKLGQMTIIVISSPAMAKEVLQKHDLAFSSRSISTSMTVADHNLYSVVLLPVSDRWRKIRKILATNIFTPHKLDENQSLRNQKVKELIEYVMKCRQNDVVVDIGQAAFNTSLNLLSNTLFSVDLADPDQEWAKEFKGNIWSMMEEAARPNLADLFPILSKLDPQGIMRRLAIPFCKTLDVFGRLIDARLERRILRKEIDSGTDVVDVLLNICEEDSQEIDRIHIQHLCLDLFAAGTDTTSSSVEWALTELLQNPNILEKAKSELEEIIGKGIPIQESDIPKLPYLQAIVKESMRKHPPVPFLIPRQVDVDIELCGYEIPRDAKVFVNVWAMGRDPTIWTDPTQFRPERFLGSEIDFRGRDFELIPFGAGRRICPGLALAARLVPMMVGSLINCFNWRVEGETGAQGICMEEKFGITLAKALPLRAFAV